MRADTKTISKPIKLTSADKIVMASYASLLEGFAGYFGSGYEFVLHSLESLDHSVVKIVNGHHTGRTVGAPVTDLALSMLSKIAQQGEQTHISYSSKTKRGDPLHSSTIAIKGERGRTIGLLCINFHLNTPLHQVFMDLFRTTDDQLLGVQENFASNVEESVSDAVEAARRLVDGSGAITTTLRNKQIVATLFEQGIFQLKGAVPRVAQQLGLSRNTVYLHLREMQDR